MTTEAHFIVDDSAVSKGSQLTYRIRLPWYRSLPLSAILDLDVTVDGIPVPNHDTRLQVGDVDYGVDDLEAIWDRVWFIQDEATVTVPAGHSAGQNTVTITTYMALRRPYIMIGPDQPLVTRSRVTRTFSLGKAD